MFGDSPDAIPVFATAAHDAILVPMPTLENNATQPWFISHSSNVAEIICKFGGADQLRNAMLNRQTTLTNHLRRTRDLLLPRLLSGQVELKTEAA